MARIKIKNLPENVKITKADLENIRGGIASVPFQKKSDQLMFRPSPGGSGAEEHVSQLFIGTWPTPE